jgi:hypothetical protein
MEPIKLDESQRIATDERGNWAYPSLAASGHVEVELPSLPGSPRPTEQLLARDFGGHVASKIDASLRGNPYKSGPQQNPAQTLNHYIAVARGAKLVDNGSINRMEALARQLDKAADQREFFNRTIRPFLNGLRPQRRQK